MEKKSDTTSPERGSKKNIFDELSRDELITKCKGLLALAQKAKQAKSELQNEVESYKLQLEKCETETKTSQENVKTLQELVDSLTEQKLNYITEIDLAQSKVKMMSTKCDTYEEEINKLKADLITKDKHAIDVAQKMSNLDSEVISLKRQNNRLLDENELLINQLTDLENKAAAFNVLGLAQREQLQKLEENVLKEDSNKLKFDELVNKIKELESIIKDYEIKGKVMKEDNDYDTRIKELTEKYETEKLKKEKSNVKLRSYKDKILKCAACINQLKSSRFILSKTVKEYSENIPKWQNDIMKASKVLEDQLNELNNENKLLKGKLKEYEKQYLQDSENKTEIKIYDSKIDYLSKENNILKEKLSNLDLEVQKRSVDLSALNNELSHVKFVQLIEQINENKLLNEQLDAITMKCNDLSMKNDNFNKLVNDMQIKNQNLKDSLQKSNSDDLTEKLNLQIKALESEKAILVKEKLTARDNVVDLEGQNKRLSENLNKVQKDIQQLQREMDSLVQHKLELEDIHKKESNAEISNLKGRIISLQEQYDILKKEYDNIQDLNGLLREEVETLKISLEEPKDDTENLSDLNVSLQADIVKLETKLAAYKQENASLLVEVKESRNKIKEFDSLVAEYEEVKSKLTGYKSENTELLNEMKEINQVLKERGEAISKLQKAVTEMERLIETLEKDRDNIKQDRDDIRNRVCTLENDLKHAEQKGCKSSEATEKIALERDTAITSLAEKDTLITNLKDEIEKLRHQQTSSELPNEDMSTSTISKAEELSRMKDLDETFEEKYTKLRIFALKLKKKLNETTGQLENAERDKAKLEKLLNDNSMDYRREKCKEESENSISELEVKLKTMEASAESAERSEQLKNELEKIKAELIKNSQELTAEVEAHKVTKEKLEKARRDVKKKNVLSLEMEDYEKSMKDLMIKMEEINKKVAEMNSTITAQEATITASKTQIKFLEEQIEAKEIQTKKVKEELLHVMEESKEKESTIQLKNGFITKLEQSLEEERSQKQETDLELTSLLSEKERVIMCLGKDKAELNNKLKKLEIKCGEICENLRITSTELANIKTEYTSYKVRAQAVLRQNQIVDHSQLEQLKKETAALRCQIGTLTAKLVTAQEQCAKQSAEMDAMRRRAAEAASDAARAQQRTARLQADLKRITQQIDSERDQHKLQISTLTQSYKTQIKELEEKLREDEETLKKQLPAATEKPKTAKVHIAVKTKGTKHNQHMLSVIPKEDESDGEMDINVSMIPREEGEGSESAPSPPLSKAFFTNTSSSRSPVPLERLLEEGVPDDELLDAASLGLTPEQEITDLRRKLLAQEHRVKHVTVLLSESERECARMAQLSELLKSELRRVRGTTQNAHNTEYMKNVTLKFLTLPPGDERSRLVPVLQKILTLTSDETQKIQAIAKGLDPNPNKGWGSYLPWPGGK